ncbi:hypothetical protein F5Y05DRAFT_224896 [Hypoxylon sp. FL0543]|nr:hypothetical protein F5Y05DRAFT_224896 [Hypoxylon sp. FL0543]
MDHPPQHVPSWGMFPSHPPGSRLEFINIPSAGQAAATAPTHSAPQQLRRAGIITPPSPIPARLVANYEHVHDPMYYRPTFGGQATAAPEHHPDGPHLDEIQRRRRRRELTHAAEQDQLRRRVGRLRSSMLHHRCASPGHSCCGERPSDRQAGSHERHTSVVRTLPAFSHGLPTVYNPWAEDTAAYTAPPSQRQRQHTRAATPPPENQADERGQRQEGQAAESDGSISTESPDFSPTPSCESPPAEPEGRQQPIQRETAQRSGRDYFVDPLASYARHRVPPAQNDAASDRTHTVVGGYDQNIGGLRAQRTRGGPTAVEDREEREREHIVAQPVNEMPVLTSALNRGDTRAANVGTFNVQRPEDMVYDGYDGYDGYDDYDDYDDYPSNVGPYYYQQPQPQPQSLPLFTSQRARTHQPETRNTAPERSTEPPQRTIIAVDGDCYLTLDSPDELLVEGEELAVRMMPFVHVRGDLYIQTTAPRQEKRKREESSEDDKEEVDINGAGEWDAENPEDRPAKRR